MGNWTKTHMPCPDTEGCGSQDGAAMSADDGSIHCFACGQHFLSKDHKADPLAEYSSSRIEASESEVPRPLPFGSYQDIPERGISERTCRLYRYEVGLYRSKVAHFAQISGKDGISHVATHIRILPKSFVWAGSAKESALFGQHLGGNCHLVITEGELDAMSVHEAFAQEENMLVAVSVTSGPSGGINNIKRNLLYVGEFDRVTILFDSDDVGQDAARKAADLIGPKARIAAPLGYKDANEAWMAGDGAAIHRAINHAPSRPAFRSFRLSDLINDAIEPEEPHQGLVWPWDGWCNHTLGLKPGEVWMIGAGTGIGKSTVARSIALHLALKEVNVGFFSLESTAQTTQDLMMSERIGESFPAIEPVRRVQSLVKDYLKTFMPYTVLVDEFNGTSLDEFVRTVRAIALNEETRVVVIDSLSWLTENVPCEVNQRRAIDKAMRDLKALAMELRLTIVITTQLNRVKTTGASPDEGSEPRLSDLRNTHSLAQVPDYVWLLSRNPFDKKKPHLMNCWLKKNRVTGRVGLMSQLKFNPDQCRFGEVFAAS